MQHAPIGPFRTFASLLRAAAMKFLSRVALPILLVVGMIGGVTFVSQYSGTQKKLATAAPIIEDDPLRFLAPTKDQVTTVQWEDQDEERWADLEIRTPDHYDFLFNTSGKTPVDVSLKFKNCGCARVYFTELSPREARELIEDGPAVAATVALNGTGGLPGLFGGVAAARKWAEFLETEGRWQMLDVENGPTVTIPPARSAAPVRGIVRLSWEGKREGREGLRADLWVQQKPAARLVKTLRVPLNFVPALRVSPASVTVPDLGIRGREHPVEFMCWSSTRGGFPLMAREESGSPCFVCTAQPLDAGQREELSQREKCRVLAGYRVTVTVHESRDGQPLDLGPFHRRILLTAGPGDGESAAVTMQGMVRGEVTFLNPEDKDRIDLGLFRADRGGAKTVPLETSQDGPELQVSSRTPTWLDVHLARVGGRRWNLTVEVPANRLTGRLPDNSAVIVRTQGAGTRRMRIPVTGQATR